MFDHLPLLRSPSQFRARLRDWAAFGEKAAIIPVFGPAGPRHLALMAAAQRDGFRAAACLFEDGAPPRDLEADADLLERAAADAVFAPVPGIHSSAGWRMRPHLAGLTDVLGGREEPARKEVPALALLRVLVQTGADALYLDDADWQFCVVMGQIAGDLDLPVALRILPVLRDADGLPASAATAALPPEARRIVARLLPLLRDAAREVKAGAAPDVACRNTREALLRAGFEAVEYVETRHCGTLAPVSDPRIDGPARIFAAVRLGGATYTESVPAV